METLKAGPNTPASLKVLEQRVPQLVGCPLNPPPLDNVVGSKKLRSEKVDQEKSVTFRQTGF